MCSQLKVISENQNIYVLNLVHTLHPGYIIYTFISMCMCVYTHTHNNTIEVIFYSITF